MRISKRGTIRGGTVGVAIIVSAAGAAGSAGAQTGFSGTYTFATTNASGQQMTHTITQKPGKMRFDSKQGDMPMSIIMDAGAQTTTIVMHSQKMYATQPQGQMPAQAGTNTTGAKGTITKTGQTKVVAGVSCDVYHFTGTSNGKDRDGDACVAKGVGFNPLDMVASGNRNMVMPDAPGLRDMLTSGYGVLEASSMHDGKSVVDFQITAIDRTPPNDALFAPPAGYQAMPAGAMGRMAMPGNMMQKP